MSVTPRFEPYEEGPSLARRVAMFGLAGLTGLGLAFGIFILTVAYELPIPFLR